MNTNILLVAALLPAALLLYYIYRKDTVEKEPMKLIVRVVALGALGGPVAAIIETILIGVFEAVFPPDSVALVLITNFIGVALVEECVKLLALLSVVRNKNFNYMYDAIVYAVAASLGFAALENVLYVFDGGLTTAVVRAVISVPGHCTWGVIMGFFFGLAKQRSCEGDTSKAALFYMLSLVAPIVGHGIFDAGLTFETVGSVIFAFVFQLASMGLAVYLVNYVSKRDRPFGPTGIGPARIAGVTPMDAGQFNATMAQINMQNYQPVAQQAPMVGGDLQSTAQPMGYPPSGQPAGYPIANQPVAGQPTMGQPAGYPAVGQPAIAQPMVGQQSMGQPAMSQPASSQPAPMQAAMPQQHMSQPSFQQPVAQMPNQPGQLQQQPVQAQQQAPMAQQQAQPQQQQAPMAQPQQQTPMAQPQQQTPMAQPQQQAPMAQQQPGQLQPTPAGQYSQARPLQAMLESLSGKGGEYGVRLEGYGSNYAAVYTEIRDLTKLPPDEARALIDNAPVLLIYNTDFATASQIQARFAVKGALVQIVQARSPR